MTWTPSELEAVARRVGAGEVPITTVRTFLSWFRAQRRGSNTVATVRRALRELELTTLPSFENAWIDAEIEFHPRRYGDGQTEAPPGSERPSGEPRATPPTALEQAPSEASAAPSETLALLVEAPTPTAMAASPDPVHRVGKLAAANNAPLTVSSGAPLQQATTLMLLHDYSQLPVMKSAYRVEGMVSWRSIGRHTALHGPPTNVSECLEAAAFCSSEDSVFEVAHLVHRHGCVLVRSEKNQVQGLLTATDLSEQFGTLLAPFLLIGEIEGHLRALLDERLSLAAIQSVRDPSDTGRVVESAADLTFGEYKRLLEDRNHWATLGVTLDRGRFVEALEELRQTRNDLMHFQPEGLDDSQLRAVRQMVQLLRDLRRSFVQPMRF